ncbi:MAG: PRC-barrel domain-containing protein [Geminicoccaceae bacterium]
MHHRGLAIAIGLALTAAAGGTVHAQSSGQSIVEEALRGVEQDQARDSQRVRDFIEEAVRGAEQAPSGKETVTPTAPETLKPLGPGEAPELLPVGFEVAKLVGQPVDDGTGARLGTIRDVAFEQGGRTAHAVVEFDRLFGRGAKTAAVPLDTLTPSVTAGSGYVMALTAVAYDQLPAYAMQNGVWRRQG